MAITHRFEVVIEGIEMDDDTKARISQAVQRAALNEFARLDFRGDLAARFGDGGTQGIWIVELSGKQGEELGLTSLQGTESAG